MGSLWVFLTDTGTGALAGIYCRLRTSIWAGRAIELTSGS